MLLISQDLLQSKQVALCFLILAHIILHLSESEHLLAVGNCDTSVLTQSLQGEPLLSPELLILLGIV